MIEDFSWDTKYRPKTISETILPAELKTVFQQFVENKHIPHMMLCGSAGIGKTTVAKALLEELNCDYIMINCSIDGGIDTIRNTILTFATSVSLTGGRKYVILDEADFLSPSSQPALRSFIEEHTKNCGFILTCNYKNRIIEPLHSRCPPIDFKISKAEIPKLAAQFMKRIITILELENIKYDKASVAALINKYFPDFRRIINELQKYSASGEVNSGVLNSINDVNIATVFQYCKNKDIDAVRKWVQDNNDTDQIHLFRAVYDQAANYMDKQSVPFIILKIAEYSYKSSFVADRDINMVAFFIECMIEVNFT